MSSPFKRAAILLLAVALGAPAVEAKKRLRVCSDPDNLPYSNAQLRGFENKLARMVARELNAQPEFVFARMRRGFVREQLNKRACDVLIGVPENYRFTLNTVPYYRASYMFVARRGGKLDIASFDDKRISGLRIGLQALDENFSPPVYGLLSRRHSVQLVPFETFGRNSGTIIDAVAQKKVDLAIVWGPIAGFYARRYGNSLELRPVSPKSDGEIPYTFAISMGVRKSDTDLRDLLNAAIAKLQPQIDRLLTEYGVPYSDEVDSTTAPRKVAEVRR